MRKQEYVTLVILKLGVCENIECNSIEGDMMILIYDCCMIKNKKLNSIIIELFIRSRKVGISIVFITQSYLKLPKDVRLNTTHSFIMKITIERDFQQIALNGSSDVDVKDFIKIYKKCTAEPYSVLVNDTTLPSNNSLRFIKNILE